MSDPTDLADDRLQLLLRQATAPIVSSYVLDLDRRFDWLDVPFEPILRDAPPSRAGRPTDSRRARSRAAAKAARAANSRRKSR